MNAPSISTHVASDVTAPACPVTHWVAKTVITISGSLQSGQQYERERATDSGGTSWVAWVITTNLTENFTFSGINFGPTGGGSNVTKYFKGRVRVIGIGGAPCTDWTETSQLSKTHPSCAL